MSLDKINCKFCDNGNNIIEIVSKDGKLESKIMESDNFYVIVSIGAIVEGYLLIIPKDHYLSMGNLPYDLVLELEELSVFLKKYLNNKYNLPVISFEHGTGSLEVVSSASVTHAHLHLVPVERGLLDILHNEECKIVNLNSYHDLKKYSDKGMSYLFYEDIDGKMYSIEKLNFPSQYFRKLVCENFSEGNWNWREDYRAGFVINTLNDIDKKELNDMYVNFKQ